jgi:uncharacterized protein YjaZ
MTHMQSDLLQIEFYFPNKKDGVKSKEKLADLILGEMREKGSTGRAGFSDEKLLHENILNHIGNASASEYLPLSKAQEQEIKECIEKTVLDCNTHLFIPTKNHIFVFPYLPTEKDAIFEGVMGFAPYSCVFHIFLSPKLWSSKSLANTVAHELNHTIFYYHHYDDFNNYSLLDQMILEGLAENFREFVLEKTPAPWAVALTKDKAFEMVDAMDKKILFSKDQDLIKDVLFGNNTYSQWTGYSIGYWLVKELLRKKSDLPWELIMKLTPREILKIARK